MSPFATKLVNVLLYQTGWFCCVLGAAWDYPVTGALSALALGFLPHEAASIAIIGGADGPTSIFLTAKLAPHLIGPIAIAAYSYMALIPVIQPPIMRLLTTREERRIRMPDMREVSKREKQALLTIMLDTVFDHAGRAIDEVQVSLFVADNNLVVPDDRSGRATIKKITLRPEIAT